MMLMTNIDNSVYFLQNIMVKFIINLLIKTNTISSARQAPIILVLKLLDKFSQEKGCSEFKISHCYSC